MADAAHRWTFLSNYAHVLITLAKDPDARLRDIAEQVGITERAAQRIASDLVAAGVLSKDREGRRNRYAIDRKQHLRHPLEEHATVGNLIDMVLDPQTGAGLR